MRIGKGTIVWVKNRQMLGIILDEPMGIGRWKVTSWNDLTFFCIENLNELIPLFRIDPKDLKLSREKICEKYLMNFLSAIFELLGELSSTFKNWQESHIEHYHTP